METSKLKKFAQFARRSLIEQVSSKLNLVLTEGSAARREEAKAIAELEKQIQGHGREQIIERIAYIWFNRFCALRFMDVNRYTRIGILSPAEGQFQPEILAEAKMGHIDEEMVPEKTREQIFALLGGSSPSRDPQSEAYRFLVVAACNDFNKSMPYLFEKIADYTELLMPDDLLSGNSILAYTREAMTPDVCQDVEVIGWLYQFYISEKKDKVFDDLKKNKKITPENIPAATQLFTPHWIVRYLVENSLGRLWMLNRPNSKLVEQMDYYIKPEQAESDFLHIGKPEEIKMCDPACGSGHILTYTFDLLYAIYEEEGYDPVEIPEKILTHNLYGIEIDERAGELAAFALTMKARGKQRRFFNKGVKPNICVLENVHFNESELKDYIDFIGRDLFTAPLQTTLKQFEEADNFGSLIRPTVNDVSGMLNILESKNVSGQLFLSPTHQKVLQALQQADYLSPKYHVVVANPPYMGGKGMNGSLGLWLKDNYPDVKSDLFSAFIVRITEMTTTGGYVGMMTPFNWLFLSSFEKLRTLLLGRFTLTTLVRPEFHAFFDSAYVTICGFSLFLKPQKKYKGVFIDLQQFYGAENQPVKLLEAIRAPICSWRYIASSQDFCKIPGSPIAYWLSDVARDIFSNSVPINELAEPRQGMATSDVSRFIRFWYEVTRANIGLGFSDRISAQISGKKWFPHNKGGEFRRWYGNNLFIVNWLNDGEEVLSYAAKLYGSPTRTIKNISYYFRPSITWSMIGCGQFSVRITKGGFLFDVAGPSAYPSQDKMGRFSGLLNSKIAFLLIKAINPTLNYNSGDIAKIPINDRILNETKAAELFVERLFELAKADWDSYESSWDFNSLPMLQSDYCQPIMKAAYQKLRAQWLETTLEMKRIEEKNNRIFIEAYGLQDELTPEVPLNEITLTCNPHYRYSNSKNAEELEVLLRADTMKEFISYAVGCMFGRYSLDKPGLILANQGETIEDYWKNVRADQKLPTANCPLPADSIFLPDADNVIPILDGDWFTDDISERFRQFLRITFGIEHYEENLKFIEQAFGKDIRKYFLKDFYNDHVRRYKKRPIYWLFSSPKGNFNALIYMHRYRSDTVSVVLNYLREFRIKLTTEKNHLEAVSISASASPGEKTKALKEIESIRKMIEELDSYEREILYPLATEQLEIDLDDGVKVNYQKFGPALRKIPGLDVKEE